MTALLAKKAEFKWKLAC
jgi:hypothetical protein